MKTRLKIIGGNLSRLACSLTGGDPWETLSGRAWRLKTEGRIHGDLQVWLFDGLTRRFRYGHCQKHYAVDQRLKAAWRDPDTP